MRAPGVKQLGKSTHASAVSSDALIALALALIGMSVALDRFVPLQFGGLSATFLLGLAVGTLGYWSGVLDPILRRYLRWMVPFLFWAVLSVLAVSKFSTLRDNGGALVWFLLVPGIAVLMLEERRFRAFHTGLVVGASVLLAVVVWRFVRGARILDEGYYQLLGVNRNFVDLNIVWLIPSVLWSETVKLGKIGRWLFVAAAILWLVSSQGRTGLLALLLVPLVYVLLKPAAVLTRAARIAMVTGLGFLLFVALTSTSIPGLPATERLVEYQTAERTESDELRLILNEKSFSLASKYPLTGVGWGLYGGQYDPAVEKARTERNRERALIAPAHNTYLDVLATTGVPGFIFFVGMALVPLLAGIRHSANRDVRAITAGYTAVLFTITFHGAYGTNVSLPMALLLAAVVRARVPRAAPEET